MRLSRVEEIENKFFENLRTPIDRFYVFINERKNKIWTLSANTLNTEKLPIVLIHGFMASIVVWRFNIDSLAKSRALYAFDLLGFGRSSRPKFSNDPIEAENQFVDSIEEWRKEMKLEKFILVGHSFGGYLAALYSIKYPSFVKGLILADPWGFIDSKDFKPLVQIDHLLKSTVNNLKATTSNSLKTYFRDNFLKLKYYLHADYYKIKSANRAFLSMLNLSVFLNSKNPCDRRMNELNKDLSLWFLFGENSWIISSYFFKVESQRSNLSKTFIKVIENAGHNLQIDNSTNFNHYLESILNDID